MSDDESGKLYMSSVGSADNAAGTGLNTNVKAPMSESSVKVTQLLATTVETAPAPNVVTTTPAPVVAETQTKTAETVPMASAPTITTETTTTTQKKPKREVFPGSERRSRRVAKLREVKGSRPVRQVERVLFFCFVLLPVGEILLATALAVFVVVYQPPAFSRAMAIWTAGSLALLWLMHIMLSIFGDSRLSHAAVMRHAESAEPFRVAFEAVKRRVALESADRERARFAPLPVETYASEALNSYWAAHSSRIKAKLLAPMVHIVFLIVCGVLFSLSIVRTARPTLQPLGEHAMDRLVVGVGNGKFLPLTTARSDIVLMQRSETDYRELNALSTVTDHLYFNTITVLTIGFGDIHPRSQTAKIGSVLQGLGTALVLLFGVGYTLAIESFRIGTIRTEVLAGVEASVSAAGPDTCEGGSAPLYAVTKSG